MLRPQWVNADFNEFSTQWPQFLSQKEKAGKVGICVIILGLPSDCWSRSTIEIHILLVPHPMKFHLPSPCRRAKKVEMGKKLYAFPVETWLLVAKQTRFRERERERDLRSTLVTHYFFFLQRQTNIKWINRSRHRHCNPDLNLST